jgi:hypothetical protein
MKAASARSSRAPASNWSENRAPAIFAARSKSRIPSASPISQCGRGGNANAFGVPALLAVRRLVLAARDRLVRHVRNPLLDLLEVGLAPALVAFEGSNLFLQALDFGDPFRGWALFSGGEAIPVLPAAFELRHDLAAPRFDLRISREVHAGVAFRHFGGEPRRMLAEKSAC